MLFKHPDGKHNGEFLMLISSNSEMKLKIFAPIVGSLIYELRLGPEKFLVLNFPIEKYIISPINGIVNRFSKCKPVANPMI